MAAVVLLSASCSQDNETIVSATNERATFTGIAESIGISTRAHNAYSYDVLWDGGERIYVKNGDKSNTFTLSNGEGTTIGKFIEDNPAQGISGNIEAFYPASLKTADGYVWPATQGNNQVAPMYAKQSISGTENEVVSFSSLGAMLQIVFSTKTEGITVTSITLQSNKKPLSGKFTVDENGQAIMTENSENPGVTLDLSKSSVPVGVAAKYFYLAIPAGTYSTPEKDEVMTITFKDDVHDKECVMTTTFPEVERNTVGRITLAKDFTDQGYTVKFNMKGHGEAIQDTKVAWNQKVTAPSTPKAANYAFWCWCTDAECTTPYDFSKVVTADITLYAKWTDGINGHAYVKLAGKKWATENVGYCERVIAYGKPGTTGNNWGFYFYNQTHASSAAQSWGSETDASHVTHSWTLPSEAQWKALIDECYWEWTDSYNYPTSPYNGMSGHIVYEASDGDKGLLNKENSGYAPATDTHIFLPAAGMWVDYPGRKVNGQGGEGYYWSADNVRYLLFYSGHRDVLNNLEQYDSRAVRPVLMKDLTPTTGTAEATIKNVKTDVKWVQLWENGPKFAEHNVGATSATECGGYYCWGGTYQNGVGIEWNEKCKTDWGDLTREEDTATTLWGNNWRMPTMAELSHAAGGLLHECDCKWVTNYNNTGVNGLLCTGKGDYAENSMFLPAAGRLDYGTLWGKGDNGHYWSSSQYDGNNASPLFFNSYGQRDGDYATRSIGYSVRAVLNENK